MESHQFILAPIMLNGPAESINKIIKKGIQLMVDPNLEVWHELLLNTLWAYQTTKRSNTRITPFALTYVMMPFYL